MSAGKRDERFIFLIGQAQNRLFTRLDQALMKAGEITTVQSGLLYYLLEHEGCLQNELSRALLLDKSAITGLIDRLEGKGLVARRRTVADRRAMNIYLMEEGKTATRRCLAVTREFNDAIKEGLSREEIDTFSMILQRIIGRFSS